MPTGAATGADILLTRRQINIGYSPDNERIIYDGTVIRPGIVEMAGADDIDREEVQELTTADWNEGLTFWALLPKSRHGFPMNGNWMIIIV